MIGLAYAVKGDVKPITITVTDDDGVPVDLTGVVSAVLLYKVSGGAQQSATCQVVDVSGGVLRVQDADRAAVLAAAGDLILDARISRSNGEVITTRWPVRMKIREAATI